MAHILSFPTVTLLAHPLPSHTLHVNTLYQNCMHLTLASHTTGKDSISIINDVFGCKVPTPENMCKRCSYTCSITSRLLVQPQTSTPYNTVKSMRALISFLKFLTDISNFCLTLLVMYNYVATRTVKTR